MSFTGGSKRPGEGELFEEYFSISSSSSNSTSSRNISEKPFHIITEDCYNGVDYKIFVICHGTREGEFVDSHYTGYIHISEILESLKYFQVRDIPPAPGHTGVNFGPTEDGWIGFGTLDHYDFNYTSEMDSLEGDKRISQKYMIGEQQIFHFTPRIIEECVCNWIDRIKQDECEDLE